MTTFQIFNADCLEKMKDIPDKSVDLIICDLPYGCLGKTDLKIKKFRSGVESGGLTIPSCAWDVKINLEEFWKQIKRIRKNDHTPTIHFCNTKFGYDLIKSNEKEFRYDLVWCKSMAVGFLSANKKPLSGHENIYIFSKKGAKYNRIDIQGDFPAVSGGRKSTSIQYGTKRIGVGAVEGKRCLKSWFEIKNSNHKSNHPTAKPIELYKLLISRYSNEGDMVLDPTAGSFNSGEVCRELNRSYIGIEMNEPFYNKAIERFGLINNLNINKE